MRLILGYLTIFCLFILGSCSIPKDASTGKPPLPAAYRNADTADAHSIADMQWKTFFTDANLRTLIDSAIRRNYDMQTAIKNIEAAKLIFKQSRLGYLPDAKLQVTGSLNRPSDNSLNGLSINQFLNKPYVEDYTAAAVLSWEADIWGKIKNQKAKALSGYLRTEEVRSLLQTNLVSFVAVGYYNLMMLDAQLAIAKKNLLLSDSTVQIIRLQFNAGQVTVLGIQQAEAQRSVAAQLIPQLEQSVAIQENALSVLTGSMPGTIVRSGMNEIILSDKYAAGVPASLLENRPDLKIKERELTMAGNDIAIARANMYPSLNITAAGGVNSFKASNWFSIPASLFATAAGNIVQPLFQKKQLKTQYELAKIEREKIVLQFRGLVLTAVGEVSDALVRTDKLKEQYTIATDKMNTLQQSTGSANLLFKNGMANYLEVITAQSKVLQAELEQAALRKDQLQASVELYRSLGGGWR